MGALPAGKGAGEQWVRMHYARLVAAYRARAAHAGTALLVVIDADTSEVDHRFRQLQDTLAEARLKPRSNNEKIAHLVLKRSIETWILFLTGSNVNETTDYRNAHKVDDQVKAATLKFFEWSRKNASLPQNCLRSLVVAIPEIRRLE
ncbi:MAG TPA: hypothetical protein VG649_07985 [Candidatus Angelobacter sp.]|jgi:hypothetical protein|nr:hypothetical protein [Candidatus Angelobacter sp.]